MSTDKNFGPTSFHNYESMLKDPRAWHEAQRRREAQEISLRGRQEQETQLEEPCEEASEEASARTVAVSDSEIAEGSQERCSHCGGSGFEPETVQWYLFSSEPSDVDCSVCDGKGRAPAEPEDDLTA